MEAPVITPIKKRKTSVRYPKLTGFNGVLFFECDKKKCLSKLSFSSNYKNNYRFNFVIIKDIWNSDGEIPRVSLHSSFDLSDRDKSDRQNFIHKLNSLIDGFKKASLQRNNVYIDLNIDEHHGEGIIIVDGENFMIADCSRKLYFKTTSITNYTEILTVLTQFHTQFTTEIKKHNLKF
ncbi:MAG: hypothetical protein RBT49_15610 [Bacteroidales bacterium]|jgi:hypothetical protein|nr:hypothetical protein [Bacteroidales bacterium]